MAMELQLQLLQIRHLTKTCTARYGFIASKKLFLLFLCNFKTFRVRYVATLAAHAIIVMLALPSVSTAQNYAIGGTVTSIGCQAVNTICFVTLSGTAAGPPGCQSTDVRWDSINTPNGTATIAQLTAAYLAGKQVLIVLSNSCFSEFSNYPTLLYYIISG